MAVTDHYSVDRRPAFKKEPALLTGETRQVTLESVQEDWNKELVFSVPREHAEVQRLEGKFRSSGGLSEGMIVELANGQQAQVVKLAAELVVLDANHAMAGRKLNFDVELIDLDKSSTQA